MKLKAHRPLLRLYLLALFVRLVPVLLSINLPIGLDDMYQYDMLAQNLAAGNGFRWYGQDDLDLIARFVDLDFVLPPDYEPEGIVTSFRAPAYPLFLSAVYLLVGGEMRWFAARLANALLTAALAPLAALLARELFPGSRKVANIAGLTLALYPMLLVYPLALATENLFSVLLLAGTVALLRAENAVDLRLYALAGLLFGLAALTRSVALAVLPLVCLYLWLSPADKHKGFKRGFVLGLLAVLVISPWVLRNTLLHGKLTLIETSMGYNLHMGYHPEGNGTFTFGISLELLPYVDDLQRDELGRELAWGYIQADPARVPLLTAYKLGHFFDLEIRPLVYFYSNNLFGHLPLPILLALLLLFALPWMLLSSLAALGAAVARWERAHILAGLVALGYLLPHIFIMAESRFHLALVPIFAAFAAYGWSQRNKLRHAGRWRIALLVVLLLLLWGNWGWALWEDAPQLAQILGPGGNQLWFDY